MENENRLYDVYDLDEDIKILKDIIYYEGKENKPVNYIDINNSYPDEELSKFIQAIEHLIEAYRKVKEEKNIIKENLVYRVRYCNKLEKELYGENTEIEITNIEKKYFVPKSKIKEIIKELEKDKRKNKTRFVQAILYTIGVLQELLEEE